MASATEEVRVRVRQDGAENVSKKLSDIGRSASIASSALRTMRQFLVVASFLRAASAFTAMSDALDDLQDKVDFATRGGQAFSNNLADINKIARDVREPLDDVGNAYSRVALLGDQYGMTQESVNKITGNTIKLFKLYGGSAQDAANFLDNFLTKLEGGKVTQRQWTTLLKESPPAARALAAAFGQTSQSMGAFITASGGLLDVQNALKGLENVDISKFSEQAQTFGEALSRIRNEFLIWMNSAVQGGPVMNALLLILNGIANVVGGIMNAAIVASIALLYNWAKAAIAARLANVSLLATIMTFARAHPYAIILTSIAAIIGLIQQWSGSMKVFAGENLTVLDVLVTLWDKITTALSMAWEWFTKLWANITGGSTSASGSMTFFGAVLGGVIGTVEILGRVIGVVFQGMKVVVLGFQAAWEVSVNAVSEVWTRFVNLLKSTANFVIGIINKIFGSKIQPYLKEEIQAATEAVEAHGRAAADLKGKIEGLNDPLEYYNKLITESEGKSRAAGGAYTGAGKAADDAAKNLDKASSSARSTANSFDSGSSSANGFASSLSNVATQAGLAANGMAKLNMQTFQGGSYTGGAVNLQQASAGGGFTGSGFSSGISQQGVGNMGLVGTGTGMGLGSMSSSGTMSFSSSAGPEMRAIQQQLIAFYKSIGDDSKAWQISQKSTSSFGGPGWENPLLEWRGMLDTMNKKIAKMEANQQKQIAIDTIAKEGILTLPDRIALAQKNISDFYGREQDIVYQSQLQSMISQGRLLPGQGGASGNVGQVGWGSGGGNLINPNTWLGMASGGAFQMPGNFGGKDSMLAALRLAPGEEVHVRRPRDKRDQERGRINPPANYNITFNVQTPDADSFRHNQTQMGQSLLTAIRRAERQRGVR